MCGENIEKEEEKKTSHNKAYFYVSIFPHVLGFLRATFDYMKLRRDNFKRKEKEPTGTQCISSVQNV